LHWTDLGGTTVYKQWINSKQDNDKQVHQKYKSKIQGLIDKSKKGYYQNAFLESSRDIKKTWNHIKEIIGGHVKSPAINCLLYKEQKFWTKSSSKYI